MLAAIWALCAAVPAEAAADTPGGPLERVNSTPFPTSRWILAAAWATPRYDPPSNQSGDILPTVWSADGATYVLMDDGGVDVPLPGALWRQSLARATGGPPQLRFSHVGDPDAPQPQTWAQIRADSKNHLGPLGPYYSSGFTEFRGVFYATQQRDWNWNVNGAFTGLSGIAYSRDRGDTWQSVHKPFPAPLGNLSFVDAGRADMHPDGFVYAIGTEREFDGSRLILGRVRADGANVADPSRWQWYAGTGTSSAWTAAVKDARPVARWNNHITYPQMSYDAPLHRYLLTFTYSYASQPPQLWRSGAELVILESPSPSGPFSFVARSGYFGPSNGYGPGFPTQWISRDGRELWLKWAANFAGCSPGLRCSGKYGFNLAQIRLSTAAHDPVAAQTRRVPASYAAAASIALLLGLALTGRIMTTLRRHPGVARRSKQYLVRR